VNDVHVPVGKAVRFVMTSDDVLHDFFVPDMRVKADIVPGRYTQVWFTPTMLGLHTVTCAEYCGKGHSDMQAKLTVESEDKYKEWIATGGTEWMNYTPEDWGSSVTRKVAPPAIRSTEPKGRVPVGREFTAKWRS
jgi:cytochrome c oxidase subunit II